MASIKIKLRNKSNKDGYYPVVLQIIKDRKTKIITLNLDCKRKDWDYKNQQFKKSSTNHLQRNRILLKLKDKAYKIVDDFQIEGVDFTLTQFEDKYRGKRTRQFTVKKFWEEKIADLNKAGKTGNARCYHGTMTTFFKFEKNENISFKEIDVYFLEKFETHLRSNGYSDGGISVRMRTLKALINDAIKKGVCDRQYYPFKTYNISRFKTKGIKKALSRKEIRKIEELDESKHPHLTEAKKLFMFSYFTGGMNFHDMMLLTWNDIENDRIIYVRSKTKAKFSVKILKPVEEILKYFKSINPSTPYVFPILPKAEMTPIQIENRKSKMIKKFNAELKEIARVLNITKKITSYVARHSYASNLKHLKVSTDIISEAMGHANIAITTTYLKEFDQDIIDKANERLLEEPSLQFAS
jgi:integrase